MKSVILRTPVRYLCTKLVGGKSVKSCSGYLTSIFLLALFLLLVHSTSSSQTIKGSYPIKRDSNQVKNLLELFKKDDLVNVPLHFFGKKVIDKELPDLIVFIDKTGKYTNNKIEDIPEHV